MQATPIGWTDFSGSLIKYLDPDGNIVHACIRASEGCRFCYAAALAGRWGRKGRDFTAENMKRLTPFFDEAEAKRILGSKKIIGQRFFVNDMTDWMGPWVSNEIIDSCIAVFALRPDVTFQTLTKHADRQRKYFTGLRGGERFHDINAAAQSITQSRVGAVLPTQRDGMVPGGLPLRNLHVGVSVEDQKNADKRIPELFRTPAAMRWISAEPLLGPLDLIDYAPCSDRKCQNNDDGSCRGLQWVVVGGESGAHHRVVPVDYFTFLVKQCRKQRVPVFVKQDSGPRPGMQGRIPDKYWLKEFPK